MGDHRHSKSEQTVKRVVALVSSLTVAEGGSPAPFYTGYRAILHYDGRPKDELHGVEVAVHDGSLESGRTGTCTIKFLYPEFHAKMAHQGATFELMDGPRVRARGRIESIEGG